MRGLNEVLKELGVPERKLNREVQIVNEPVVVYAGGSQEGYHGYHAGYKVYDPYNQLREVSEDASSQYVWAERVSFSFVGEKPAAVSFSESDMASSYRRRGIYLFLPEGMVEEIIFEAQEKETVYYSIPPRLLQKWIRDVSAKEGRDPKFWKNYGRVERKVAHKALVYASYQFAKDYTDKVGVIHNIWGGYVTDRGNLNYYGTSVLVKDGKVEFVDYKDTFPDMLQSKYGVLEYYPIEVDI